MMYAALLLGLDLVVRTHWLPVHGPDGQKIDLNINEVSSVREIRESEAEHFNKNVNCIVFMTNGKFIGTIESCTQIEESIERLEGTGE